MTGTKLKVNNRKKYIDGWDIVAVVDTLDLYCSFAGIIKTGDEKYKCWKFYNKENKKPVRDNETMLKVKDTFQKYFSKAQLQGFTSGYQYAPELYEKYLGVKVR